MNITRINVHPVPDENGYIGASELRTEAARAEAARPLWESDPAAWRQQCLELGLAADAARRRSSARALTVRGEHINMG